MRNGRASRPLPIVALLCLLSAACSAVQFWEEEAPPPVILAGSYQGRIAVDGQSVPGTLDLVQEGRELRGVFRAPRMDLEAEGNGRIEDDDAFSLALRYRTECPGTVTLEGAIQQDGARLAGTVRARDCTGEVTGTFTFDRS